MNIKANDLMKQFDKFKNEYEKKVIEVLNSGFYVLGNEVKEFEKEFAEYIGTKHCVGLACGLDALILSFKILGLTKGDDVIVCSNSYIACVMGITANNATPVFVEPDEYYNIDADKIQEKITKNTKAILAVHMYGQSCNMNLIRKIADKYNLFIVEDCSQAHGAYHNGKKCGTFSNIACFSFYPSKNLGAFGDAGAIVTDNEIIAEKFRVYRNYGSEKRYHNMLEGANSRLDELQAGLLRVKLSHLDELNLERERLANIYLEKINNDEIILPQISSENKPVWHLFVIRCKYRDELKRYLKTNGIETLIHYPIPPHLSQAYEYLGYNRGGFPIAELYATEVLSLPLYEGLPHIEYICDKINRFISSKIHLRALIEKDIEGIMEWINDNEINRFFSFDPKKITVEKEKEFIKNSQTDTTIHLCIADENDDYLGTISLKNIDANSAEYSIVTRRKAFGKGIGFNATISILDKAFNELGLKKVYLNVLENNIRAKKLYKRVGFKPYDGLYSSVEIRKEKLKLEWFEINRSEYEKLWGV